MNVGYLQRRASREQCSACVWGPLTPARDDARDARSDNQMANNINKTSVSPLRCPQRQAKPGHTPLYCKHLHSICHSFVTVTSKPILHTQTDKKKKQQQAAATTTTTTAKTGTLGFLEKAPSRAGEQASRWRLFGLCRLCGQRHDDVCTPAMAPG